MYREMNEDEVAIFTMIHQFKEGDIEHLFDEMKKESWVLKAIEKHCAAVGLRVAKGVQIMILAISDGVIGYAVKYLRVIYDWATSEGNKEITMDYMIEVAKKALVMARGEQNETA